METKIELNLHEIHSCRVEGIDHQDAPDYCDAYISEASIGQRELTEAELEWLNEQREFVYSRVMDFIH